MSITQDVPYLILRIIIIIKCGIFSSPSLIFFLLKNFLMVLVNVYRISSFYIEYKAFVIKNKQCKKSISIESELEIAEN